MTQTVTLRSPSRWLRASWCHHRKEFCRLAASKHSSRISMEDGLIIGLATLYWRTLGFSLFPLSERKSSLSILFFLVSLSMFITMRGSADCQVPHTTNYFRSSPAFWFFCILHILHLLILKLFLPLLLLPSVHLSAVVIIYYPHMSNPVTLSPCHCLQKCCFLLYSFRY